MHFIFPMFFSSESDSERSDYQVCPRKKTEEKRMRKVILILHFICITKEKSFNKNTNAIYLPLVLCLKRQPTW